ncbi:hypothetical protein QYE76_053239 [Lolium multiflorum]|uniref:Integrase zinc-binding domain-containing protein n=1 Tax=Lolium multiflorum TaxID=4521 RepID=A0AAD8WMC0_LOLMU|nr:hypothetical protein QYE76_053239 [Lolium multiflorum]
MYLETLEKMNLTKEQLKHSTTEFHGVVPGKKANSLGSIKLPVAFGDVNNYREEMITFEVVPFKSSYHVIFSRPTYHKFHARACYIYNKLKIPGPNMITVSGDYKKARDCEKGEAAFAESVISGEELRGYEPRCHIPTYDAAVPQGPNWPNVHAYVDDIAVMTRKGSDLLSDLKETFDNLRRRTAIKSQVLADFIADWTEAPEGTLCREPKLGSCTLTDPSNIKARGWSYPEVTYGEEPQTFRRFTLKLPTTWRNTRLYYTVCASLRKLGSSTSYAAEIRPGGTTSSRNLNAKLHMAAYRDEVDEIAKCFLGYEVKYVEETITAADMLSKLGSGRKPIPPGIFLEHLRVPSVKGANPENPDMAVSPAKEVMAVIPAWTQPFLDYLIDRKLPEDEVHARQIIRRARSYTIVDGQLYKRSANGVFLKCVSNQDGIEILREIHAGDCGHHAAPRSLIAKVFRLGFYWLTAKEDAEKLVKTCRGCQYYATQPNAPPKS